VVAGVVGKFGAVLSCIPDPVLGGVNLFGFGLLTSLGLSYLEAVDLRSSRNLVVLAVSFSAGMAVPAWMNNNPGVIDTGRFINMRCSTAADTNGEHLFFLNFLPTCEVHIHTYRYSCKLIEL